jgi:gamma-carbonic anhydrase
MIYDFKGIKPAIDSSVFIAPSADIIGNVTINKNSSIWFHSIIRGDINFIEIGENTNIQDMSVLHVTEKDPVKVGNNVSVGHSVTLHGCTIGDRCLIGMGAIVLNKVVIGKSCIIAAGAVIIENTHIPDHSFVKGIPAKVEPLNENALERFSQHAEKYALLAKEYLEMFKNN